MHVIIHTDGGSRGNPGPAAAAAIIKNDAGAVLARESKYLGVTTNNQAEYVAIILGLSSAKELGATEVTVCMDTELAQKQLTGVYRVKNEALAKRFVQVHNLQQQFRRVEYRHVFREKNTEADHLVNTVLDKQREIKDS